MAKRNHKPLIMVNEPDYADWYLKMEEAAAFYPNKRPATAEEITPLLIAEMLDDDAENSNHHSFVGTHKRLASMLMEEVGIEAATDCMRNIVDWGGLHNA